jgi:hypothetical protein
MMSLGRTTLKFALSQAPEHVEGEEQEKIVTLRFCNPRVGFTQAPEHVEGEGLLHDRGDGRARHTVDHCLN